MKQMEFDKSLLDHLHGLSCIENYVLYLLRKEGFPYQYLYYQSYLSFREIADDFVYGDTQYAYFYKVKRLQNLAVETGSIQIQSCEKLDLDFICSHDYICVMVKSEYIKEKYNVDLWREDHYILLSNMDGFRFNYLNDTPRDVGIISFSELKQIYGSDMIAIDMGSNVTDEMKQDFLRKLIKSIHIDEDIEQYNLTDYIIARDILGICRVLRKRIYEFSSMYIDAEFLKPYLYMLDQQYLAIEYSRLRRNADYSKVNDIMLHVAAEDAKNMKRLLTILSRMGG